MPNFASPAVLTAARKQMKKHGVGTQALMGVIDGAAKVTGQIAGAVERATDYSKKVARKDDEPAPEKDDNSWTGTAKRAWKTVHRQLAPVTNKLNYEAKKIRQETEHHSGVINMKQGKVGTVTSKATEMLPELMTAGSGRAAKVVNNTVGAIKDYGENKSVPGAIAKLLVPGNSKTSNVASSLLSDKLAEARKEALSK